MNAQEIYESWQRGDLMDLEALRLLTHDLGEAISEAELAMKDVEKLRGFAEEMVRRIDKQRGEIAGYGTLSIREATLPKEVEEVDKEMFDQVVKDLTDAGDLQTVRLLRACVAKKTKSGRAGGLVITPEKKGNP